MLIWGYAETYSTLQCDVWDLFISTTPAAEASYRKSEDPKLYTL